MRLFRLMAEAQEELLKSPYPDLLMEMAVIRMAALAPVMDANELLRAIGNSTGGGSTSSSGSSGGTPSAGGTSSHPSGTVSTRRMKVEGEVNATAPARLPSPAPPPPSSRPTAPLTANLAPGPMKPDLPELRDFIRTRRAALAGFMEQGASLALNDDVLSVNARNDIYIRYLSDNRATIAELAGEFFARPIKVEVSSNGTVVSTATGKAPSTSASPASSNGTPKSPVAEVSNIETAPQREIEPKLTVVRDSAPIAAVDASPKSRAGGPEDRQAVLQDPEMRRIFDELEARLVEVRVTPDTEAGTAKDADAPRKD